MKKPFSIWENLSLSEVDYALSKTDTDKVVKENLQLICLEYNHIGLTIIFLSCMGKTELKSTYLKLIIVDSLIEFFKLIRTYVIFNTKLSNLTSKYKL